MDGRPSWFGANTVSKQFAQDRYVTLSQLVAAEAVTPRWTMEHKKASNSRPLVPQAVTLTTEPLSHPKMKMLNEMA